GRRVALGVMVSRAWRTGLRLSLAGYFRRRRAEGGGGTGRRRRTGHGLGRRASRAGNPCEHFLHGMTPTAVLDFADGPVEIDQVGARLTSIIPAHLRLDESRVGIGAFVVHVVVVVAAFAAQSGKKLCSFSHPPTARSRMTRSNQGPTIDTQRRCLVDRVSAC